MTSGRPNHQKLEAISHELRSGRLMPKAHRVVCQKLAREIMLRFDPDAVATAGHRQIQTAALERWNDGFLTFRSKMFSGKHDLDFFFRLFDDCFFRGALRALVSVVWILSTDERSHTRPHENDKTKAVISIVERKDHEQWNQQKFHETLCTLLHEMTQAVFLTLVCQCSCCWCRVTKAMTWGVQGHGPISLRFLQAVEKEANRSLRGMEREWNLESSEADAGYRSERAELERLWDERELGGLTEQDAWGLDLL